MTRMEALEAVAEAAEKACNLVSSVPFHTRMMILGATLQTLSAIPPEPEGQTVEVAVWKHRDGAFTLCAEGGHEWQQLTRSPYWELSGTTRLAVKKGEV